MKKNINILPIVFIINTQLLILNCSAQMDSFISKFQHLTSQQLFDTGKNYFYNNIFDTAMICYNMIINTVAKENDVEHQKRVAFALNHQALIHSNIGNNLKAYELYLNAIQICETFHFPEIESKIYNNIGNLYYDFNKCDIAKSYYLKALNLCTDSIDIARQLTNLGNIELKNENFDSTLHYLNRSQEIWERINYDKGSITFHNMASVYQKKKQYDLAFYFFRLAIDCSLSSHIHRETALNYLGISNLFLELKQTDSAIYYVNLSKDIAQVHNFIKPLADCYLTLSKIEKLKKNYKSSLEFFQQYAHVKDSWLGTKNFGDINQMQRFYEVTKTNKQIEKLAKEKQERERTIYYQKIFWFITLGVLFLVSIFLLSINLQKRRLKIAYKTLFNKNRGIIALQKQHELEKYNKSMLTIDMQDELLEKILTIFEDNAIIYDPEFSLERLAELVNSNRTYVSQVINAGVKKNFNVLLNGYRIREAQRLFSEFDMSKFTIESVALQVGFKSPSAFRRIFKEITGVSPTFYLHELMQEIKK